MLDAAGCCWMLGVGLSFIAFLLFAPGTAVPRNELNWERWKSERRLRLRLRRRRRRRQRRRIRFAHVRLKMLCLYFANENGNFLTRPLHLPTNYPGKRVKGGGNATSTLFFDHDLTNDVIDSLSYHEQLQITQLSLSLTIFTDSLFSDIFFVFEYIAWY